MNGRATRCPARKPSAMAFFLFFEICPVGGVHFQMQHQSAQIGQLRRQRKSALQVGDGLGVVLFVDPP
jgi:hypothetical protein